MDLKSGYPFWAIKNGLMCAFPQLQTDIDCDVVVVGGGITGSLIADELANHDFNVVVVEQRDIGWGSSAASTALLQYEIDTHMVDLATMYGEQQAVLAYQACAAAIIDIAKLADKLGDVDFSMQHSLYYASKRSDSAGLHEEYLLRKKHQFDVQWLDAGGVKEQFGIKAPCAIVSKLAACIDPYRTASKLLLRLAERGGEVFDRTVIASIKPAAHKVTLLTPEGQQIQAKHVVMATGYASQKWLKQLVAKNRSSYAFITDPMAKADLGWLTSTMAWESARPYLYMRTTGDNRLLVGGDDDDTDIPARRDKRVDNKAKGLVRKVEKLLPELTLRPAFSWAGTFAETADGLPFFGEHPQWGPRVQFAMAFGGNGISYSMVGAGLLRANIEGRHHKLAPLFGFSRITE